MKLANWAALGAVTARSALKVRAASAHGVNVPAIRGVRKT
jgi:hypothetical protein